MKVVVLFFIIFLNLNEMYSVNIKNKIENTYTIKNHREDEDIKKQLEHFANKIKDNKYIMRLNQKGVNLKELRVVLERYAEIKSKLKKGPIFIKNNNPNKTFSNITKNEEQNIFLERDKNMISDNHLSNFTKISNENTILSIEKLITETKIENDEYNQIFPLNVFVHEPKKLDKKLKSENLDLEFLLAEKSMINNIPIEDCNKEWDYYLHGDDWNCMCQSGLNQSPIDITINSSNIKLSSKIKKIPFNIFLDFKNPELSIQEDMPKLPLIKNTGNEIIIEDDFGVLVMPPHMNGYKCFKIELHTPAEHKINQESFEMEIQIYCKMEDKRIVDMNTKDYIIISVLVKGLEKDDVSDLKNGKIIDHPFLELLELDKLPNQKGHARLLNKFINFDLLFDTNRQPYTVSSSGEGFLESSSPLVRKAFNDLIYNKNYPIKEFFFYEGSFNKPPCEENVHFIIMNDPIFAAMSQIIKITKVVITNGNKLGNNRNVQELNGRNVYHFKEGESLAQKIKDLNFEENGFVSKKNVLDETIEENVDKYIDQVITSGKHNFNKILSLSKLI